MWRWPHAVAVGEALVSLSPQSRCVPQGGVGGPEQEGIQEEQAGELCCGALAEENRGAVGWDGIRSPLEVEVRGRVALAYHLGQSRGGGG